MRTKLEEWRYYSFEFRWRYVTLDKTGRRFYLRKNSSMIVRFPIFPKNSHIGVYLGVLRIHILLISLQGVTLFNFLLV